MQQEREEKIRKGTTLSLEPLKSSSRTDEKRLELIESIIKPGKLLFSHFQTSLKLSVLLLVLKYAAFSVFYQRNLWAVEALTTETPALQIFI